MSEKGEEKKQPDRSKRGQVTFFSDRQGGREFDKSFARAAGQLNKLRAEKYVSPKNVQRFQHGGAWHSPANPHSTHTDMKTHTAETATTFDDLIDGNLDIIVSTLKSVVDALSSQLATLVYSTVHEASDASGNVVDARTLGIPAGFIAMLEKIEFSADKDGKVRLPEMHLAPTVAKKVIAELEAQPSEFQDKIEAIKARKIEEALRQEIERKGKFESYGE